MIPSEKRDERWAGRKVPKAAFGLLTPKRSFRFRPDEPRRDFRRLQLLRGWSHDEENTTLFTGGPRAGGLDGFRPPGRGRLAGGGDPFDRCEDRLLRRDAAQLGRQASVTRAFAPGRRARNRSGSRRSSVRSGNGAKPTRSFARPAHILPRRSSTAAPSHEGLYRRASDVFGVEPICRVLPIAPLTYDEHASRKADPDHRPARERRDAELCRAIRRVFEANFGVYGVRKVWRQMKREGIAVARGTVARLMRQLGLKGVVRGKSIRTTLSNAAAPGPRDRVNRQFQAPRPNALWVSDFTSVTTWSGFVHVAFAIDAFARRIVGWRVSRSARADFVLDALEQAPHERQPILIPILQKTRSKCCIQRHFLPDPFSEHILRLR